MNESALTHGDESYEAKKQTRVHAPDEKLEKSAAWLSQVTTALQPPKQVTTPDSLQPVKPRPHLQV